jgi:hypothetical protein
MVFYVRIACEDVKKKQKCTHNYEQTDMNIQEYNHTHLCNLLLQLLRLQLPLLLELKLR